MEKLHKVTLPSGGEMVFHLAPFAVARELHRAVTEEAKALHLDPKTDIDVNLLKDLFCTGLSSKKIEEQIWRCFEKAMINNQRITEKTFEPEEMRDDYFFACMEVGRENILPFTKSLFAKYKTAFEKAQATLKSLSVTKDSQ